MEFQEAKKIACEIMSCFTAYDLRELSEFRHYADDDMIDEIWYSDAFDKINDMGIEYSYGCSKLVLFPPDIPDWCIKIPFISEREVHFNEDDETDELDDEATSFSNGFLNYQNKKYGNGFDYCLLEAFVYNISCSYGVSDLLCGTFELGEFHGYAAYLSEKADKTEFLTSLEEISADSRKIANIISSDYKTYELSKEMTSKIVEDFGAKKLEQFLKLVLDLDLTDFHSHNVGFRNNKISFFDYSGYFE